MAVWGFLSDDCTWFVKGWDAAVAAGHTPTEIPENYKHCNVIVPSSSQIDSTQKSGEQEHSFEFCSLRELGLVDMQLKFGTQHAIS